MNKKIIIGILILLIAGIAVVAWQTKSGSIQNTSEKIQVVASFYPVYFFARQIGGDKADVTNITPAGAEPHDYEPTAH